MGRPQKKPSTKKPSTEKPVVAKNLLNALKKHKSSSTSLLHSTEKALRESPRRKANSTGSASLLHSPQKALRESPRRKANNTCSTSLNSPEKSIRESPRRNAIKTISTSVPCPEKPVRQSPRRNANKTSPTSLPCSEKSLGDSPKRKAISVNLQKKLSKKRKRVEEVVEQPLEDQEGLKLLKRGPVSMVRIVRRKMKGIKPTVLFNTKGESFGPSAAEMQSYIGVLARTKAPICYDSWKRVPQDTKKMIWECVQMGFNVPKWSEKMVLNSAGQKWREFKSRLTTQYVLPHRDQRQLLKNPPSDYSFIEKAHWDVFVAGRLSNEFLEVHNTLKKRRKMNDYPHRMSRKGYANLEQELSQSLGDSEFEIDRSTTWVLARKDKEGNFKSEKMESIASEIEKMKKKVVEGEVTEEGVDDVLTKVLGNPEHRGRVRGQGRHVRQSTYFDLSRKKKGASIEEKIQAGIQKFMAEETSKIIEERDAFWVKKMDKLKEELFGKIIGLNASPPPISQQGSCNKSGIALVLDLDLNDGPKKKLNLVDEKVLVEEKQDEEKVVPEKVLVDEDKVPVEEEARLENLVDQTIDEFDDFHKEADKVKQAALNFEECQLAIGSPTNVVADASVDTVGDILHGKSLGGNNARVTITRVIQGAVKIPFPIGDEILTVEQALGTYVAWPRELILKKEASIATVNPTAPKGRKTAEKKLKNLKDCISDLDEEQEEYVVNMGSDYPASLKSLWVWANDTLKNDRTYNFGLHEDVFGYKKKQFLFLSDFHSLCFGGEFSGAMICIFIHALAEDLKKNKMENMVAFVDPGTIGAIGCGSLGSRARGLAARFKNCKPGQYFLLPYNNVNHWMLTVVNPDSQVVYHMDPLRRRLPLGEEWSTVVDNAIKYYREDAKKPLKKKVTWENMAGVPLQHGNHDCGLFVIGYMKEICEDKDLSFHSKWQRRSNHAYGRGHLAVIRTQWAQYFLKNYVHSN